MRTNKIPRQIPEQPWYMNPVFSCLVGGVLPFGAVFIELFFILTSMWLHQVRVRVHRACVRGVCGVGWREQQGAAQWRARAS